MTTLADLERVESELRADAARFHSTWTGGMADIIAAYVAAQREREWQPIETAPKDGTWFLAISAGRDKWTGAQFRPAIVMINPDGNYVADDISDEYAEATPSEWPLTHWMPLPKEPKP